MAMFCQEALGRNSQFFFVKNGLKIDRCTKFQPDWTKGKGTRISSWNDTKNCLTMSYLPHSDDVSKTFMAFERFCHRVPSYQVWW